MISRRILLGTGALAAVSGGLLVAADRAGRLDDLADLVGLDPKPLADPVDTRILRRAAAGTAAVLATVEATARLHPTFELAPVAAAVGEQLVAVGGARTAGSVTPPADPAEAIAALEAALRAAATSRATDAEQAASAPLVRVLATMAAGHAQSARVVKGLS